ncbi:MAG: G-D-S-L family lipolytic protein [Flavobacteriaceae bacterium]|nr:G-D-S-L family lipolytic protein [Flavobacteriaceae bacterium]
MKNLKYIFFSFLLIGLYSCNEVEDVLEDNGASIEEPEMLPALSIEGTGLDFSNYIAVGPSFSAGVSDGTVFLASQNNSWPNIMSMEFSKVGGGEFKQPTMDDNFGGLALGGTRIVGPRLVFGGAGPVPLESVVGPVTVQTDVLNPPTGPFNNLGVPGARSFHFVTNGYGNVANLNNNTANPYATRLTGATPNASIIELAASQNPSFFTLSLFGGNDVLGYATGGADQTTDAITLITTFETALNGALTALTANDAKGVVSGTPHVTDLPYFTTVPHNPLDPTNPDLAAQIPLLNQIYGAINGVYTYLEATTPGLDLSERNIVFVTDASNPLVIKDEELTDLSAQITGVLAANPDFPAFIAQFGLPAAAAPLVAGLLGSTYGQSRPATENDLVVLPAASEISEVDDDNAAFLMSQGISETLAGQLSAVGVTLPMVDKWVVTETEIEEIILATDAMNDRVEAAADSYGIAYVDLQSILAQASSTGIMFDDYLLDASLVTGGLVSLDGIHLTARGYAYMANSFLEAIDEYYGSNFVASGSLAKADDYPIAYSPLLQ